MLNKYFNHVNLEIFEKAYIFLRNVRGNETLDLKNSILTI